MAKLTLILALAVFGVCLATPVRNRRKPQRARSQQRFSSQFHDKFIYGHDDEPDYNDDHTSYQFGQDFQQEYNNRTPYKQQGKPEEENIPSITEKFIDENLQGNNFGNFEGGKAPEVDWGGGGRDRTVPTPLLLEGFDELVEDADDPHDLGEGKCCWEDQIL